VGSFNRGLIKKEIFMKLMFCKLCATLVVPDENPLIHNSCKCGENVCWWDEPTSGKFAVWSKQGYDSVRIIGIHNGVFRAQYLNKPFVKELIAKSDGYLFKEVESLIINIVPGESSDTRFANLNEHI
jgi:hypothetical protein